ncbi:MAG: HlyD family efflux transporter periplasmic adaptor subunit [Lachnospiraceae bacterium]|nr:HlyD family efflux transporter periplasmic adaptor subunit [Lachnospiraceae bacterium]
MKRRKKKWMAAAAVLILAAAGGWMGYRRMQESRQTSAKTQAQTTAKVERRDIASQLSSSGTLEPKDTYTITSLVEGEVALADFEEGDQVEKGQILYQIDATSMESEIQSANNSLARAQESLSDAQSDYGEIQAEISGNTYKATKSGFIKELYIDVGDKVGANTKICDIYDDLTMEIRLPFLSGEAAVIAPGSPAVLTLTDTGEQVNGIVTAVSEREEALTGGTLVRQVTIEAANPGGLTTETAATAAIGDCLSASEADFEAKVDTVMSAELDSNVEVEALLVNEGSYITKGTPIFRMTAKSAEKLLKNYSDSVDKAKESLETAQNKVDSTQDSYENYTITAPISGQVITKTAKQGDNISKNSGSGTTMAVIYDLSALTFEMWIDELDIQKVQVGQTVQVTADAAEGQTFTGTVTNVSLESSASNGVTNYPVTVTMESSDGLLPGMNVDGVIILEQAEDTLSVPVDSLMRGNLVYVKDDTVTEADGAVPAGFRAVEVETGLISEDYVEIASGLEEGQEVYVSKSSKSDTFMMMPGVQMGAPMDGGPAAGGAAPAGGPGGSGGGNRSGGSGSQGGRP